MKKFFFPTALLLASAFTIVGCSDENESNGSEAEESDAQYVGKAVGNFTAEEWQPGGELGTTDNITSSCYEDNTPAVEQQGLNDQFQEGECALHD